ncbi:acetylesterase (plasmid) [Azospirillum baldaniorum]|uniref:Acetyl esterase n=1 Tax=Azospirillum baldaniorum TaxID=1064539 RepID=A0A9P1JU96_9PROT|nr:alpha/beta hydrolase [Azospirillum baldaniorum]AWJ91581.1 acetylesterase [Azospirillum baldaniorum]TWA83554.1 acetyl esterase [Azospirillum brasilense]CCC99907.1 acetyl esterase [Azospirillum baldaniorum]
MPDTILRPTTVQPTTECLDPQVIAMNEAAARLGAAPADPLSLPLAEARAAAERYHAFLNGPAPLAVDVTEVAAAGPAGPLALRLYRPADRGAARLPVLVYFHGGGFVVNSVDTHDRLLRLLALHSGAVVCAVRYSLAPERRFPHQHEEALAALHWVAAVGAEHGIDAARIAVGGDSAGANLALGLALAARAPGEPRVSFGLLFYGMFAHDFDTVSHRRFGDGRYGLTTARMRWYWGQYLGGAAPPDDPRAAPLLADLRGLPSLLLLAADLDCLRDDSLRLAERLAEAGVSHRLAVHDGLPHSFATMTRLVDQAHRAVLQAADAVRRHLDS